MHFAVLFSIRRQTHYELTVVVYIEFSYLGILS